MIKKAIEQDGILNFIEIKKLEHEEYVSDLYYNFCNMLENPDLEGIYIYLEDDKIKDFIYKTSSNNQVIVQPLMMESDDVKNEFDEIFEKWGSVILEINSYEFFDYPLKSCEFKSTVASNKTFVKPYGSISYYTNDDEMVSFFVRDFERRVFPKWSGNIECEFITNDEDVFKLTANCDDYESRNPIIWKNSGNVSSIAGFRYFSYDNGQGDKFLVARDGNNLLGVIKVGEYDINTPNAHQAICYIDVKEAYWNKGIAKVMIANLNQYLNPDLPLVLTKESDMGQKCQMIKHFKDAGFTVPVYEYDKFYQRNL